MESDQPGFPKLGCSPFAPVQVSTFLSLSFFTCETEIHIPILDYWEELVRTDT